MSLGNSPKSLSRRDIPRIAQRFSVGWRYENEQVPEGRLTGPGMPPFWSRPLVHAGTNPMTYQLEIRRPKSEGRRKPEGRNPNVIGLGLREFGFGFLSDFGLR